MARSARAEKKVTGPAERNIVEKRTAMPDAATSVVPAKRKAVGKKSVEKPDEGEEDEIALPSGSADGSDDDAASDDEGALENAGAVDDDDDAGEEEESSDEDEEDAKANRDAPILEAGKLPSSKDDAAVKARLNKVKSEKVKTKTKSTPGVLYLGRLPHGFFEEQLRAYFSQFGDVTRVRLSRNRSTGAPKHYGFIEFADRDVAQIVQETMDNYLLNGHLIQVKEVPKEKIHEKLWVGSGRKFRPIPRDRVQRLRHNEPKSEEQKAKVEENLLKRESKRRRKLAEAGIDYEFDGYKSASK